MAKGMKIPFLSRIISSGDSRTANVKKNIIGSVLIKGISILVSFMLVPMTIGYVSSELYGVWLTLSSILTWLCFLDVGFSQGLKNRLTEAIAVNDWDKGKSLVSTTYFLLFLILLPMCILLEFLVPIIDWCSLLNVSSQYGNEIVKVMHVLVAFACLQIFVNVLVSVIAAFQKVALSNSFVVIGNILSLIIIYILTKTCPPSLLSLAFSLAAMPVIVTIVASFILYSTPFHRIAPHFKSINLNYVKDLFGLGYKFFIINIQVVVLYQSTNVLISNVSSPNEVTYYNVAYRLLSCAMMIYIMITGPLWPAYTDAYVREDYEWMKNMRKKMTKILLLSVVGCAFLLLMSPFIYKLWIGDRIHMPFMMTFFVFIYVSANCWVNLNSTLIVGMGKVRVETYLVIVGMLLHIPLALFFSRYCGAYGVLLSLIIINFFYAFIMNIQVNKILNKKAIGIWNE